MKIKYSNVDVKAIVKNFQDKYISLRLNNIYIINSKNIVLKLVDSTRKKDNKFFIKLVSGFRCHTIDKKPEECMIIPNSFCAKLRKHLNNKRLTDVHQLGFDRIIDFNFDKP